MPKEETKRKHKELMRDVEKKHKEHQRALDKSKKHHEKMKREYEHHMKSATHNPGRKKMDYKEDRKGGKKKR